MRYAFFSVIVVAVLSATTAQAQRSDPDRGRPGLWNGIYAGVHAGVGLAGFDGVFDSSEVTGPGITHNSVIGEHFELDDGLAGLQIGYSRKVGRMVYGLEADWTKFDASDRQFDPDDEGPCGCATDNAAVDVDWLASLRGRLGVLSSGTLLYATAGVAWMDGEYEARDDDAFFPFFGVAGSADLHATGFVIGGGMEHALADAFGLRFEFLYYGFGERTDTRLLNFDSDDGDFAEIEDILVARMALSYGFGDGAPAEGHAETAPPAMMWSGIYLGIQTGFAQINFDSVFDSSEIDNSYDLENSVVGRWFDLDGGTGGVSLGINRELGRVVLGLELDVTYLGKSDRRADPEGGFAAVDSATVELDWLTTLRGRLGLILGRTLLYGTVGGAWINGEYTVNDDGIFEGSKDLDDFGFVVGGGMEHGLTKQLTLRLEGLHYVFDDKSQASSLTPDSDAGDYAGFDDLTLFRVGLSHRIGGES